MKLAVQLETAANDFKTRCSHSIFDDRLPGDLDCGNGLKTLGSEWNRSMSNAGIPATTDAREQLAKELDLNPSLSLVLAAGLARGEVVRELIAALKKTN
ncbi:hypothetical protein [Bradyrhizobium japonicum]|uniref:hypothetical protein n=1 Tax=Bradyrhizobium japonicum TaxID=375 RepID=UPI001E32A06C|nr:hypothetical protein [Bradyrhizobium japonicum]MCD9892071.1 hypothetical protein [Bradyrhizobium japonicum]WRJ83899.1 hypothetical protein R3F78_02950 [Bradyrhizobium japonicum]WRJ92868.1 hypothetical protein R3F77_00665 [Bradyrhizobium japonicum]WRK46719.1 hypothetical protein R3F73_00720 [Bradyrhizobium japonicum]